VLWGIVFGVIQAAALLGFWWLAPATVYALALTLIAFVANTRWWPPFCLVVDWVAAAILVVLITVGVDFHH
jgi:hypothetical protein